MVGVQAGQREKAKIAGLIQFCSCAICWLAITWSAKALDDDDDQCMACTSFFSA